MYHHPIRLTAGRTMRSRFLIDGRWCPSYVDYDHRRATNGPRPSVRLARERFLAGRTWRICGRCESINLVLVFARRQGELRKSKNGRKSSAHERFCDGRRRRRRAGVGRAGSWPGYSTCRCASMFPKSASPLLAAVLRGVGVALAMLVVFFWMVHSSRAALRELRQQVESLIGQMFPSGSLAAVCAGCAAGRRGRRTAVSWCAAECAQRNGRRR